MSFALLLLKALGCLLFLAAELTGVLLSALTLPGSLLVLLSAVLFSAATAWHRPSPTLLLVLGGMTLVAEGVDGGMALLGVKIYGGSGRTSMAAGLGAFGGGLTAGVVLGPLVSFVGGPGGWVLGSVVLPLLGALAGGFTAAYLVELRSGSGAEQARKAGVGALTGRVLGAVAKVTVTSAMAVVATVAAFWPGG